VIPRTAANWETVAYYLGYEVEFVRLIKKQNRSTGDLDCCIALFEDWLSTNRGTSPKTWSTLIRILREIKTLTLTTEKIVKDLAKAGVFV